MAERAAPDARQGAMTPAQWYCALAGGALLLAGLLGWLADASFGAGDDLDGSNLIVFEVNGWHNLVHIASGLVLLAVFRSRTAAKAVAIGFGVVYGLVALLGLVDGSDVLGIIPVNGADNVLHIALALAGLLAGLASATDARGDAPHGGGGRTGGADRAQDTAAGRRVNRTDDDERFGRDKDALTGRPRDNRTITRS